MNGISFSISSSSPGFLRKRGVSSSMLKAPLSIGESISRGSIHMVSKKTFVVRWVSATLEKDFYGKIAVSILSESRQLPPIVL